MGFTGEIWPVHPKAENLGSLPVFARIDDLPQAPDASFLGINRHATVDVVSQLSAMGAGGAVCFASGFLEAGAEDNSGAGLQQQLVAAAGEMPILGPNCYGFINYLDNVLLWPDQHGGQAVDTGVAIVTQSSNIAINITMQQRALPLGVLVCAGNQAQTGIAEIGMALLSDPRITALGLHIEGIGDIRAFEELAVKAAELGKAIIALKVGKSEQARAATISHTASLAGGDAGAQALLQRLNIPRVNSLPEFLEALKLLHICGALPSNRIACVSCSGGEASLVADMAEPLDLEFPPLNRTQQTDLRAALGPMVALANPLDYHTYIWRDTVAMAKAWTAIIDPSLALTFLVVDFPRADRCNADDWDCAITAAIAARKASGGKIAMVASLPENMPQYIAQQLAQNGISPMHGLTEALAAAEAAARFDPDWQVPAPILLPSNAGEGKVMNEVIAKKSLSDYGLEVPCSMQAHSPVMAAAAAKTVGFPVVLKGEGIAHKTEAGAVLLNLKTAPETKIAAQEMPAGTFLVEEMITDAVAELLIGVVKDQAHGFVLTLGAGGTLAELLKDSCSLLIPATQGQILATLEKLKIDKILNGYRGAAPADKSAILAAILAVQNYVLANAQSLEEIEINPLLCCPTRAVAADALIRRQP